MIYNKPKLKTLSLKLFKLISIISCYYSTKFHIKKTIIILIYKSEKINLENHFIDIIYLDITHAPES